MSIQPGAPGPSAHRLAAVAIVGATMERISGQRRASAIFRKTLGASLINGFDSVSIGKPFLNFNLL
jgi:hypothetical protein